jgi:cytochrome d ubiquinol oxidase subunit II
MGADARQRADTAVDRGTRRSAERLSIDSAHEYTGDFFDLLTPFGLWTGVTLLGLCLLHGVTFLKLRTTGQLRERAQALAVPAGLAAIGLVVGFVIWTRAVIAGPDVPDPVQILAVIAVITAARWRAATMTGGRSAWRSTRRDRGLDVHRNVPKRHGLGTARATSGSSGPPTSTATTIVPSSFSRSCCSTRAGPSTSFAGA